MFKFTLNWGCKIWWKNVILQSLWRIFFQVVCDKFASKSNPDNVKCFGVSAQQTETRSRLTGHHISAALLRVDPLLKNSSFIGLDRHHVGHIAILKMWSFFSFLLTAASGQHHLACECWKAHLLMINSNTTVWYFFWVFSVHRVRVRLRHISNPQ